MQSSVHRLVLLLSVSWACGACGRLGFTELPLQAATSMEAGVAAMDSGVADLEAGSEADAGSGRVATADATIADAMPVDASAAANSCPAVPPKAGTNLSIDDMEDGDGFIIEADGRRGRWYVNNDGTRGFQTPALGEPFTVSDDGALGSAYAVRTMGSGFSTWGAALGVVLSDVAGKRCPYDVTGTHGIRFLAKGTGSVTVQIATSATVPIAQGGRCAANCEDFYATTIELDDTWSPYQLSWQELSQEGWGTRASFAPNSVMFFEFAFDVGSYFDLSIDNLAFY